MTTTHATVIQAGKAPPSPACHHIPAASFQASVQRARPSPIAFKGRVVQYVGRLLRTSPGKHHVELHDYVDIKIPVLDRMHTKRLPRLHRPRLRHPKTTTEAANCGRMTAGGRRIEVQ